MTISDIQPKDATGELLEAVDNLARAGDYDRDRVTLGLAAIVRRRARFETLRLRFDPRFGDIPRLPGPSGSS